MGNETFEARAGAAPVQSVLDPAGWSNGSESTLKAFRDLFTSSNSKAGSRIGGYFLYPESRGYVHIRSTNPEDAPVIRASYLAHDVVVLLRMVE